MLTYCLHMRRFFHLSVSCLFFSACTPMIDNHGYDFEIADMTKVRVGQTKEEVMEAIGSPSTLSAFKDDTWYYLSRKLATKSFFKPDVISQTGVIVHFQGNNVSKIEDLNNHQARTVEISKQETPTSGYDTGILKEVFGNFGNFSSNKAPTKS